jgi:hypothetical protein
MIEIKRFAAMKWFIFFTIYLGKAFPSDKYLGRLALILAGVYVNPHASYSDS